MQRRKGRFEKKTAVTCLFVESQNNSDTHLYKILISVLGRIHIFVLSGYVADSKRDIEPVINSAVVFTCLDLYLESGAVEVRGLGFTPNSCKFLWRTVNLHGKDLTFSLAKMLFVLGRKSTYWGGNMLHKKVRTFRPTVFF